MRIDTCSGGELPVEWLSDWQGLIESSDRWRSPFWRPELIATMASIRPAIRVARLSDSQGTAFGFFSYESSQGRGEPAGGVSNDMHGIITDRGMSSNDLLHLINALGLDSFRFHHMPNDQTGFEGFSYFQDASYSIDLRAGWGGYQSDLQQRGSKLLKRVRQRENRLAREHGEVQLIESRDREHLRLMQVWKSESCWRKGWTNLYAPSFVGTLQSQLLQRKSEELQGRLFLLTSGQTPIAGLYLLRSYGAWHAWNVAYDRGFASFSPGLIAFVQLIRRAPALGLETLDLSRGEERFKSELANRTSYVWEGSCGGSSLSNGLRRAWLQGKRSVSHSPLGEHARRWVRMARRVGLMIKGSKSPSTEPIV